MPPETPPWVLRYGPTALVLGASEGIGAAFSRALLRRGLRVVGAALPDGSLERLGRSFDPSERARWTPVAVDLAAPDAVARVSGALDPETLGLVVYNAGISRIGPFTEQGLETHLRMVEVNCLGALRFLHRVLPALRRRRRGGVVLLSSMAGLQGAPGLAVYAATKAFDLVLAESLAAELAEEGIDVLACVAGATRTPGWLASGASSATAPVMAPEEVAEAALRSLGRRSVVIPGGRNRFAAAALRLMPRPWATRVIDRATRTMRTPGGGGDR